MRRRGVETAWTGIEYVLTAPRVGQPGDCDKVDFQMQDNRKGVEKFGDAETAGINEVENSG